MDESLGDNINVTVIATGFERNQNVGTRDEEGKVVVPLDEEPQLNSPSQPRNYGINEVTQSRDRDEFRSVNPPQEPEPRHVNQKAENTFEFKDIPVRGADSGYSYDEPYMQGEEKERLVTAQMKYELDEKKRRARLMENRVKLSNPSSIAKLENEPAYLRREVILDDVPNKKDDEYSEWTISEDEPKPRRNNTYLHDNVD